MFIEALRWMLTHDPGAIAALDPDLFEGLRALVLSRNSSQNSRNRWLTIRERAPFTAEEVEQLMAKLGMNRAQLARHVGTSYQAIANWARGSNVPLPTTRGAGRLTSLIDIHVRGINPRSTSGAGVVYEPGSPAYIAAAERRKARKRYTDRLYRQRKRQQEQEQEQQAHSDTQQQGKGIPLHDSANQHQESSGINANVNASTQASTTDPATQRGRGEQEDQSAPGDLERPYDGDTGVAGVAGHGTSISTNTSGGRGNHRE